MKREPTKECNACGRVGCSAGVVNTKVGRIVNPLFNCPGHQPIRPRFMLAEQALAHPQSLHDALSALPFKVNLNFYLK